MTGFTFGTATNTTTSSAPSLFGNTTTGTPNLFGTKAGVPAASSSSLFGSNNPATTTTSASTGLFGGLNKTATPASTTTSLFGNSTTSAASGGSLFKLGTTSATTSTTTTGGLFGNTANSTATGGLFGGTTAPASNLFAKPQTAPAVPQKEETVTLGGIRSDSVKSTGPKAWRNEHVPEPVCKLVDDFKKFLKEQKDLKDEISRFSPASIDKVKEEVEFLIKNVRYLSHSVKTDSVAVVSLKDSVMTELKNCEIAQRTRDSTNLPLEVSYPMEYFYKLVNQFEESIQLYKVQIDEIESVMTCESNVVNSGNIGAMLNRMHQIFVTLASKLHSLHEDVKLQKEFYLNYRKVIYKDNSNIFEMRKKGRMVSQVCPTPFSDTTNTLTTGPFREVNGGSIHSTLPITTLSSMPLGSQSTLFNQSTTSGAPFSSSFGSSSFSTTPVLGVKKKR